MAKQVKTTVKLQIPAGAANPAPPVGPALGQHGVQIMDFCKQFNERTKKFEQGMVIPAVITIFTDRSFTFITKMPPVPALLKKAAGLAKAASTHKEAVGSITKAQLEEIAKTKMPDMNSKNLESCMRMVAGTARSMGITVK